MTSFSQVFDNRKHTSDILMFLLPNFGIDINSPKSYTGPALVLVMVLKMVLARFEPFQCDLFHSGKE